MRRVASLLCACVLSVTACMGHKGSTDVRWQRREMLEAFGDTAVVAEPELATTPDSIGAPGGFALVLLGDAGAPTVEAQIVADKLAQVVAAERLMGRQVVVLWLGNNRLPRSRFDTRCPSVLSVPGPLVKWGKSQETLPQFSVAGPSEWRCGWLDDSLGERPAPSYLVRLFADGRIAVASHCDTSACIVDVPATPPVAELLIADWTPWIEALDERFRSRGNTALEQLERLVGALEAQPEWPRILVAHYPVEAAGYHGLGGGDPDAIFHVVPEVVATAVAAGSFVGMLASHDRALYVSRDISGAIKRSDKVWLRRPFFQVVAGSASLPVARPGQHHRRLHRRTSLAHTPDVHSPHEGFAVLYLPQSSSEAAQVVLHAHARGDWQTATMQVALDPAPHPIETTSPAMTPCRDCEAREHKDDY